VCPNGYGDCTDLPGGAETAGCSTTATGNQYFGYFKVVLNGVQVTRSASCFGCEWRCDEIMRRNVVMI
jgi:hypothetical protein